jgi:hypothetical protein
MTAKARKANIATTVLKIEILHLAPCLHHCKRML